MHKSRGDFNIGADPLFTITSFDYKTIINQSIVSGLEYRLLNLPSSLKLHLHIRSMLTATKQNSDKYILKVGHSKYISKRRPRVVLVSFLLNCSNREIKAYLHSCLVADAVITLSRIKHRQNKVSFSDELELNAQAEVLGMAKMKHVWHIFERCASKVGWKLDETELYTEGYKIQY